MAYLDYLGTTNHQNIRGGRPARLYTITPQRNSVNGGLNIASYFRM